jgi:hypothetical protein
MDHEWNECERDRERKRGIVGDILSLVAMSDFIILHAPTTTPVVG